MVDAETANQSRGWRWSQFRLRTLLMAISVLAAASGWIAMVIRQEREELIARREILKRGGNVMSVHSAARWRRWAWVQTMVGGTPETAVEIVQLTGPGISDGDALHVNSLRQLRVLSLFDTQVTDCGIANLRRNSQLIVLDLNKSRVTDAGMEVVGALPHLRQLFIDDTVITNVGIGHLRRLMLTELSIKNTRVSDEGIAKLAQMRTLTTLSLSGTDISDDGLCYIQNLDRLTRLGLRRTRISDAGLRHLSDMPSLEAVSLSDTSVTDSGLLYLRGLSRLNQLALDGTEVTDAGVMNLECLIELSEVDLSRTKVTEGGAMALQQVLPHCNVIHFSAR